MTAPKPKRTVVASKVALLPVAASASASASSTLARCSASETLAALAALPTSASASALCRNLWLLPSFCFIQGLAFLNPVFVLYLKSNLSDSATSVSWILAMQSITSFAMELPGGMLADLVGRKYCLLAAVAMRIAGLLMLMLLHAYMGALSPLARFIGFTAVTICEGVTQALGAGTDIALLHDSLSGLGRASEFQMRLATRSMMWPLAACIASLIGGILAERFGTGACMVVTLACTLLALPVTLALTEVYPRVYDPQRMLRKRRERNASDAAAAGKAEMQSRSTASGNSSTEAAASSDSRSPSDSTASSTSPSEIAASASSSSSSALRRRRRSLVVVSPPISAAGASIASSRPLVDLPILLIPEDQYDDVEEEAFVENNGDGEGPDASVSSSSSSSLGPCPSPLAAVRHAQEIPTFDGFLAIFRAHLVLCVRTVRASPSLQSFLFLSTLLYCTSEPMHRLRALFFTHHTIPPSWFGAVGAGMFGLSSIGSGVSTRGVKRFGQKRLLLACTLVPPILNYLATFLTGLESAVVLLPISFLWGVRTPVLAHLLHVEICSGGSSTRSVGSTSGQRATVASIQSLTNKLALALCLVAVAGPLTDACGIDTTVRVFAVTAALPVAWIWTRIK